MTPARSSRSTLTPGIQLVAMSTVLALIARMFLTASRPIPVMATSRKATTLMILVRIEYLASMAGDLLILGGRADCDGAVKENRRENLATSKPTRPEVALICPPVLVRYATDLTR